MRELRKHKRLEFSHTAELIYRDRAYRCSLDNLSMNGALVRLEEDITLPVDQYCLLSIGRDNLQDGLPPVQLCCQTIHRAPSLVGLAFVALNDDIRGELLALLERMTSAPDRLEDDLERIREYLAHYNIAS